MSAAPLFDPALVARYDQSGPRYTSYPTAPHFHPGFDALAYKAHAQASNEEPIPRPLSLYVHVPFCESPCFYCGCTRIITRDHSRADTYLDRLRREIALQGELFDRDRRVVQLHLGGGTPNFLDARQMAALVGALDTSFALERSDVDTAARAFRAVTLLRTVASGAGEGATASMKAIAYHRLAVIANAQGDRRKARFMVEKALAEALRPVLFKAFKPAFLGRMQVVPFYPISDEVLVCIIELKLGRIRDRIAANHKASFSWDAALVEAVLARCTEVDSGARNVDHILNGTLLPEIAEAVLARVAEGEAVQRVRVTAGRKGDFKYAIK